MSKLSQLHAELSEQAAELGFQSVEEAQAHGYEVDYLEETLVEPQTMAHRAWLAERRSVLADLYALKSHFEKYHETQYVDIVSKTIKFIEQGEM